MGCCCSKNKRNRIESEPVVEITKVFEKKLEIDDKENSDNSSEWDTVLSILRENYKKE